MDPIKLLEGVWVVVCDGRKALILENTGDDEYPHLKMRDTDTSDLPPTSALGSDAPGRVQQSANSRRSSLGQTDWHDEAEQKFLKDLVGRLDAALQSKSVRNLVIVAPPRALGAMRGAYTDRLRAAIQTEIDKDLTAVPVREIEDYLTGNRRSR